MFKSTTAALLSVALLGTPASALTLTKDLLGEEGTPIGNVRIDTAVNGVLVRVFVEKDVLTTGWHGLHFHAIGDCSDHGEFKLSGGHVGKIEGAHGLKNPLGPEFGDMPNIFVPHQHAANAEFYVRDLTLVGNATDGTVLLDEDGSAIVIHAMEDDHSSQPIGGSGARVACADLSR